MNNKIKVLLLTLIIIFAVMIIINNLYAEYHSYNFHYQWASFYGTEFFPDQDYKKYNYFDINVFTAGMNFRIDHKSLLWLDLKINDKLFDKELLLDKTGISYTNKNLTFAYKYDRLQYGSGSYIYNISVKDRFYDVGVLEDYRYQGIVINLNFPFLKFESKLAANNYHTAIFDNSMVYYDDNKIIKLFTIFVPRDYEYNDINFSSGLEINYKLKFIDFYGAYVYKIILDKNRDDRFKLLNEIILNFSEDLSVGSNLFMKGFKKMQNWQIQSFLRIKTGPINNYLIYRYHNMAEFTDSYFNREINVLHIYSISEVFGVGLNMSYLSPSFDDPYLQLGIQAKINYETN